MAEDVYRQLAKDVVSRQLAADFAVWEELEKKRVGCVTPGMKERYYREKLIEALVREKRRNSTMR